MAPAGAGPRWPEAVHSRAMPLILLPILAAAALAGYFLWPKPASAAPPVEAMGPAPGPSAPTPPAVGHMIFCPPGTRGQVVNGQLTCVPTGQPAPTPSPGPAPVDPGPQIAAAAQSILSTTTPDPTQGMVAEMLHEVIVGYLNSLITTPTLANLNDAITHLSASNMGGEGAAAAAQLTTLRSSLPSAATGADLPSVAAFQAGLLLREMTGRRWS
jgi:hypothetical protein